MSKKMRSGLRMRADEYCTVSSRSIVTRVESAEAFVLIRRTRGTLPPGDAGGRGVSSLSSRGSSGGSSVFAEADVMDPDVDDPGVALDAGWGGTCFASVGACAFSTSATSARASCASRRRGDRGYFLRNSSYVFDASLGSPS